MILEGLWSILEVAEYLVKNQYLKEEDTIEAVNRASTKRDAAGKSVTELNCLSLQTRELQVESGKGALDNEDKYSTENGSADETSTENGLLVKTDHDNSKEKMAVNLGMAEETVETTNSISKEMSLFETELKIVQKDVKDKKKGSDEKAVVLLGKAKILINRMDQEKREATKKRNIDIMKAEDMKTKESSDVKKQEENSIKKIIEEVCNKNFEVVFQKLTSNSADIGKQVADSADEISKRFESIEPKIDANTDYLESLLRNNKVIETTLTELVEKKEAETSIEVINEKDFNPDYEVKEKDEQSKSEEEGSEEETEDEMRERLKRDREEKEKKAIEEEEMRKRLIKKQKEKDRKRKQLVDEELERAKLKKSKSEKGKDSLLGKPPKKKESPAEMEARIRKELECERTPGLRERSPGRNEKQGVYRNRGRGVNYTRRGGEGTQGRGGRGSFKNAVQFQPGGNFYEGRSYEEERRSRSPRKDRRSSSARRMPEAKAKRRIFESDDYGYY